MDRRSFVKNAGLVTAGVSIPFSNAFGQLVIPPGNKLPAWKGFNLLDFYSPNPSRSGQPASEEHFKWMQGWGFDFIRLPLAYPHYVSFDRSRNILPDEVYQFDEQKIQEIEALVELALKYNLHVSLNLHRAPGFCINAGFHEPYNLWTDDQAQKAFYAHWGMWAKRFKNISHKKLSFDLLNEPCMRLDMNDQHSPSTAVTGSIYRQVVIGAMETIRKENKSRIILADGNNGGNNVIPELTGLDIAQSCRGYYPHAISHYKAPWANKDPDHLPEPKWPGKVGASYLSREMLEDYYKPWVELIAKGTGVHCGECGCWNKTPYPVFISWFKDVSDILNNNKIGFALWNFIGDFGILDSGRTDVDYENWYGHKLDKGYLNLLQARS